MQAIVKIGKSQYLVAQGDTISVDYGLIDGQVMAIIDDNELISDKEVLKKAKIKFEIAKDMVKGTKVRVETFKAKSRYHKVRGFRPKYSLLKVTSVKV